MHAVRFVLLVLALALGTAWGQVLPAACALEPLLPTAGAAGPPPTVGLGTRLVYVGQTATLPGSRTELVPSEGGGWVDRRTGQTYGESDVAGDAAAGYTVVRVGSLDARLAQVTTLAYPVDPTTGRPTFASASGTVAAAGCAADYWVHPDALRRLEPVAGPDLRVAVVRFPLGGGTVDAVRIDTTGEAAATSLVYDLASGLLVYQASRTLGASVMAPDPSGRAVPADGSTTLTSSWLVDVGAATIPWADAAPPAWLERATRLEYRGSMTSYLAGMPPMELVLEQVTTVDGRGPGWLHLRTERSLQSLGGLPPTREALAEATGDASLGGYWVAPSALAGLRTGQVLDRIAVLGVTVAVDEVAPDHVTIRETGPDHEFDRVYDTASGALLALRLVQRTPTVTYLHELALVGLR